jgi:hypothetical protein
MSIPAACPRCAAPLPADAREGLCPRCLLGAGIPSGGPEPTSPYGPFAAPAPAELAPLFPQLEILELLGRGGMGAVYKARQPRLDRLVALKILPPEVGRDPAFAERFAREARALARLSHPGIVAVHDFGESGGLYYLLMEYVDGTDLRRVLRAGTLRPAEALRVVPQICEALQYAHDEGVVHRDIKPENILLDRRGRVKVADFGLAKLLGRGDGAPPLTGTFQAMGTPHYMAPEQVERPHAVDHRADIYALGVVFYELLTGELPLGRFPLPSAKAGVDARLDDVVLRTLEKEPDRRYQHAGEVRTDVEAITADRPAGRAVPPRPPEAAKAGLTLRERAAMRRLARPALLLVALAGFAMFLTWHAHANLSAYEWTVGWPTPWLEGWRRSEASPGGVGFSFGWHINYLSLSWLPLIAAVLALRGHRALRRKEPRDRGAAVGGLARRPAFWAVLAGAAVVLSGFNPWSVGRLVGHASDQVAVPDSPGSLFATYVEIRPTEVRGVASWRGTACVVTAAGLAYLLLATSALRAPRRWHGLLTVAAGAAVVALAGWSVRDPPLPDAREWNIWDTGTRFTGERVLAKQGKPGWVEDPRLRQRALAQNRDSLVADPAAGAYAALGLGAALLLLGAPSLRPPPAGAAKGGLALPGRAALRKLARPALLLVGLVGLGMFLSHGRNVNHESNTWWVGWPTPWLKGWQASDPTLGGDYFEPGWRIHFLSWSWLPLAVAGLALEEYWRLRRGDRRPRGAGGWWRQPAAFLALLAGVGIVLAGFTPWAEWRLVGFVQDEVATKDPAGLVEFVEIRPTAATGSAAWPGLGCMGVAAALLYLLLATGALQSPRRWHGALIVLAGATVVALAGWYVHDPPLPDARDWNIWDTGRGTRVAPGVVTSWTNNHGWWVGDSPWGRRALAQYRRSLVADVTYGPYVALGLGVVLLLLAVPLLRPFPPQGRPTGAPDGAEQPAPSGRLSGPGE